MLHLEPSLCIRRLRSFCDANVVPLTCTSPRLIICRPSPSWEEPAVKPSHIVFVGCHYLRRLAIGALVCWLAAQPASGITQGDFSSGDLTGWTASAVDAFGDAVSPLISVINPSGNFLAEFSTGEFASGPFISTLEQSFLVDAADPILSFNFSLPGVVSDPSGTGASPFLDTFSVSVFNGGNKDLLLAVKDGAVADPFGTAPGPTAVGPSTNPQLGLNFRADLSSLAGIPVTVFFDLSNEDDSFRSHVWLDDVRLTSATKPVPDIGGTGVLLLLGVFLLQLFHSTLKEQSRHENPTVLAGRAVFRG
jgi:hypothetical protein